MGLGIAVAFEELRKTVGMPVDWGALGVEQTLGSELDEVQLMLGELIDEATEGLAFCVGNVI